MRLTFGAVVASPKSGVRDEEYIEINNCSGAAVDISGWTLGGGVRFTFPPGTVIPAADSLFASPSLRSFRGRSTGPKGNEGRLVVNFLGHGSSASMAFFLRGTFQKKDYDFMGKIVNEDRLPLVVAMSCLNGLYADPRLVCLAEEMTNKPDGGAIAYISSSALAFTFTNVFVNTAMFQRIFHGGVRQFGPALALAK